MPAAPPIHSDPATHPGHVENTAPITRMWSFEASPRSFGLLKHRIGRTVRHAVRFPRSQVLKPALAAAGPWAAYFVYAPDGELTPHHRFTLATLRAQGFALLVVAAGLSPAQASQALGPQVDALIWKALPGFDFSAYTLALRHLAARARGADVVFMNDSVLGPLTDLRLDLARTPWRLTGYTASAFYENHIQSYAFWLRDMQPALRRQLAGVFNPLWAYDAFDDVVVCQETAFARVAARSMSVGAFWRNERNASVTRADALLADGFPFVKKSLFAKNAHWFADGYIRELLEARGYPLG